MSFVKAAGLDELGEEAALQVVLDGKAIALVKSGGEIFAVDDTCTHEKESLAGGFIEEKTIECPRHGAMFDLKTGRALSLPATRDLNSYEVKVENGEIFVSIE